MPITLCGPGVKVVLIDRASGGGRELGAAESALLAGGDHSDNVTVLAMEWNTPDEFLSMRHDIADSAMDCSFASTLDAGGFDSEADDLDEAMIERSIAEINAAIRRSAARKI